MKVLITTDWHLWSVEDTRHPFKSEKELNEWYNKMCSMIAADDIVLILGDLCDPQKADLKKLEEMIRNLPGYKILCIGNHDTLSKGQYLNIGFDLVTTGAVLDNILFTHKPVYITDDMINIHGHLHNRVMVNDWSVNHINAYSKDCLPIELNELLHNATYRRADSNRYYSRMDEKKTHDAFSTIDKEYIDDVVDISELVNNGPDGRPVDESVDHRNPKHTLVNIPNLGPTVVFSPDIIANYLTINPEDLDEHILTETKNCKELSRYVDELFSEYARCYNNNFGDKFNASIDLLYDSMESEYPVKYRKDIKKALVPSGLSDEDYTELIELRVQELRHIENLFDRLVLENIKLLNVSAEETINKMVDPKKKNIVTIKQYVDNHIDDITDDSSDTLIYDFKKLPLNIGSIVQHRASVYISKQFINRTSNPKLCPSEFFIRSLKYDVIIVSHYIDMGDNAWTMCPITYNGVSYDHVEDLLTAISNVGRYHVLLMVCNPKGFNIDPLAKKLNIKVDYADDIIDGKGVYTLAEAVSAYNSSYNAAKDFFNYAKSLENKWLSLSKMLGTLSIPDLPYSIAKTYYVTLGKKHKLKLHREHTDSPLYGINKIMDQYQSIIFTARAVSQMYLDVTTTGLAESGYIFTADINMPTVLHTPDIWKIDENYVFKTKQDRDDMLNTLLELSYESNHRININAPDIVVKIGETASSNDAQSSNNEPKEKLVIPVFEDIYKFSAWMKSNIHYKNFDKLQRPIDTVKTKKGSCHDQVILEYQVLREMGYKPKILFFIEYTDGKEVGGRTHTTIFCTNGNDHKDKNIYWFENAWGKEAGVKKFESLDEIKDAIEKAHANEPEARDYPNLEFRIVPPSKMVIGSDLKTLVENIMNEAVATQSVIINDVSKLVISKLKLLCRDKHDKNLKPRYYGKTFDDNAIIIEVVNDDNYKSSEYDNRQEFRESYADTLADFVRELKSDKDIKANNYIIDINSGDGDEGSIYIELSTKLNESDDVIVDDDTDETDIDDVRNYFDDTDRYRVVNEDGYIFELANKREKLFFQDNLNESTNDNKLYPVYIMLMHSGTTLANLIKAVTKSNFSHSSISFDSSMTKMYSFGRKLDTNPFIGSFKSENIKDAFFKGKDIPYALYMVPATKSEIDSMKRRLDFFVKNATKFKYDFTGLFKNYFGIADNPEYKYFCSRFVADILNAGRPSEHPYVVEPSLMKPEDFAHTTFAQYVTGGSLDMYDKHAVDGITKRMLREEEIRRIMIKKIDESITMNYATHAMLEYKCSVMNESAFDSFIDYVKSFKVKFNKNGDVIITRREYDNLDHHFKQSLKTINAMEKAGNIEGVKMELCKIHYMINLISQHYLTAKYKQTSNSTIDIRKHMIDLRSVMLNAFKHHLKYVTVREPRFNFQEYYNNSDYGKNLTVPKNVISNVGKTIITLLK